MQLPGAQIARRIVPGIDVDERVGAVVLERRGLGELFDAGSDVDRVVDQGELELFRLADMNELAIGMYKILEPKAELRELPAKKVKPQELDLVMVPGTAFDQINDERTDALAPWLHDYNTHRRHSARPFFL